MSMFFFFLVLIGMGFGAGNSDAGVFGAVIFGSGLPGNAVPV